MKHKEIGIMIFGGLIIGPLFFLACLDPNYTIIKDFLNADAVGKFELIFTYLIFVVGGYSAWILSIVGPLEKKLEQLEEHSSKITFQLNTISNTLESLQEDINSGKPDKMLYDVAIWAVKCGAISNSAVQRHYNISFSRSQKIVEQLHYLGVCGPANENKEPRAILIGLEEIQSMKDNGKFEQQIIN